MKEYIQYISIDPNIRFGKPCIRGTRIAIVDILQWLASGMTEEEIFEDFPTIKKEHIQTALVYAAYREEVIKMVAA